MDDQGIAAGGHQPGQYQTVRAGSARYDGWREWLKPIKSSLGAALFFSAVLLSGCKTTRQEVRSEAVRPEASVAEPVPAVQTFSSMEERRVTLRPGVLFSMSVDVDGINEVEEKDTRVLQDGTAVLPMVGAVQLDGLTLSEASARLSGLYSTYYTQKPLVRMQFGVDASGTSSFWGYVTVLGRVKKPGRVNLPPTRDLKLSGAIQGADGFNTSANLKAVRISRTDADNTTRQMVIDIDRIGEGDAGKDIQLQAGDLVYVPETIF